MPGFYLRPLLAAALATVAAAQAPSARIEYAGGVFTVRGAAVRPALAATPNEDLFRVVLESAAPGSPSITGEYSALGDALTFRPRYPLQPGAVYRAIWRDGEVTEMVKIPPLPPSPAPFVERVYPTSSELPENQLKLYVVFSKPMARGEAWRRIKLLQESGAEVANPFLEIDEELWDPETRRLTVLFDPGRIKRGLLPRDEVGPALEAGKRYTLVVDRSWADVAGQPLRETFRKSFSIRAADRKPIDHRTWKIDVPAAGGRAPLIVNFGEPLDAAIAMRVISVTDTTDQIVAGSVKLEADESRWVFVPDSEWRAGRYTIRALSTLEDLAGNRIGRAFDVDRFERVDKAGTRPLTVTRQFTVRAPKTR